MPPLPEEPPLGYDVDENAIRFSNYFHVLRELVHLSAGWLPLVAEFDLKYKLADHLHDDARAISKVKRRLYELRHPSDYPGAPGEQLTELLDGMADATELEDYLALAYGTAKPLVLEAFGIHLRELDPVSDEPSLRLLTKLSQREARHVEEMSAVLRGASALSTRSDHRSRFPTAGRAAHVQEGAPYHGAGAEQLVPGLRSESAEVRA